MTNKIILLSASIVSLACLASCSSLLNRIPDQNPPRLVSSENLKQYGWDGQKRTYVVWDRPRAFGGVPDNLRMTGDQLCQTGGFERAVGYHPNALSQVGQAITGGGYLCSGYRLKESTQ